MELFHMTYCHKTLQSSVCVGLIVFNLLSDDLVRMLGGEAHPFISISNKSIH